MNSLKNKFIVIFFFMIALSIIIEALSLNFIRLPQLYLLESQSDQKDINRIRTAFKSLSKELGVINYDNSVWDDTYNYIIDRNSSYTDSNYVIDAFQSLGLNGIHIYDINGNTIWGKSWDREAWKTISFAAFDKPSNFVKKYILSSDELVSNNDNKPIIRAGYGLVGNKLILYAGTSIFQAKLNGKANGTMVFWRIVDKQTLSDLQERAGINFTLEVIDSIKKANTPLSSLNSYITDSYRDEDGNIYEFIAFESGVGGMKFTYQAPTRLFDINWFNNTTLVTILLYALTLLSISLLVHYLIIRPILRAKNIVNAIIKDNDRSVRFNDDRRDEIGILFRLIDRLLEDVESQEQELKSHNINLQKISKTDGLTNISNRRAFDNYMKTLLSANQDGSAVSLLVCDVDYFKYYNDCYGHAAGDKALKLIAESLVGNLHEETDFVARYGGEEFVIVLTKTNTEQAISVAENLLKGIRNLNILHEKSSIAEVVTLSIGIHSFALSGHPHYEPLFKKADEALYIAKDTGRNRASIVPD